MAIFDSMMPRLCVIKHHAEVLSPLLKLAKIQKLYRCDPVTGVPRYHGTVLEYLGIAVLEYSSLHKSIHKGTSLLKHTQL